MTRQHTPRLPNSHRTRVSPGQMTLDAAMLRAQARYPEALRFVPSATGRPLALLPGGLREPEPVTPAVVIRRAA